MQKSMILEPIQLDSKEEETHNTKNWCKIKKYLDDCHMALDITTTYEEMLSFLDMTHEEYIKAVRTSIVRPKLFLKRKLSEIRLNNYMKNCLQFW